MRHHMLLYSRTGKLIRENCRNERLESKKKKRQMHKYEVLFCHLSVLLLLSYCNFGMGDISYDSLSSESAATADTTLDTTAIITAMITINNPPPKTMNINICSSP